MDFKYILNTFSSKISNHILKTKVYFIYKTISDILKRYDNYF